MPVNDSSLVAERLVKQFYTAWTASTFITLLKRSLKYFIGSDVTGLLDVRVGNSYFTCFEPNLDRGLHDGHLCAAADRSSYFPNGVRHCRLRGGIFGAQACNATWVSCGYNGCLVENLVTDSVDKNVSKN